MNKTPVDCDGLAGQTPLFPLETQNRYVDEQSCYLQLKFLGANTWEA